MLAAEDELFRQERQTTNRHSYKININTVDETILACKIAQKWTSLMFPPENFKKIIAPRSFTMEGLQPYAYHGPSVLQCLA